MLPTYTALGIGTLKMAYEFIRPLNAVLCPRGLSKIIVQL
jgi:hypothetical protein